MELQKGAAKFPTQTTFHTTTDPGALRKKRERPEKKGKGLERSIRTEEKGMTITP